MGRKYFNIGEWPSVTLPWLAYVAIWVLCAAVFIIQAIAFDVAESEVPISQGQCTVEAWSYRNSGLRPTIRCDKETTTVTDETTLLYMHLNPSWAPSCTVTRGSLTGRITIRDCSAPPKP